MTNQPAIQFVKTHPDAKLPHNSRPLRDGTGDSGYDIYCVESDIIEPGSSAVIPVGLTVAYIAPDLWFRIEARSGLGFKHGIAPHAGIIDNQYRGDLAVKLYNHGNRPVHIEKGDRIAQLVIYPLIIREMGWADEVSESDRGAKGFGSSGN